MRTGKKTLRTGSGKTLHFGSARKLENWERVAKAIDQNEPHDPETDELAKVYARKLARA